MSGDGSMRYLIIGLAFLSSQYCFSNILIKIPNSTNKYIVTGFYGPRIQDNSGQFHEGVDVASQNSDTGVIAFEAGNLEELRLLDDKKDRYYGLASFIQKYNTTSFANCTYDQNHYWRYLHMFLQVNTIDCIEKLNIFRIETFKVNGIDREFCITNSIYTNDSNKSLVSGRIAIVCFAQGSNRLRAEYILCQRPNSIIKNPGSGIFIKENIPNSNNPCISTNLITKGMILGPMGTSGNVSRHLHIDTLRWGLEKENAGGGCNPLLLLDTENIGVNEARLFKPYV